MKKHPLEDLFDAFRELHEFSLDNETEQARLHPNVFCDPSMKSPEIVREQQFEFIGSEIEAVKAYINAARTLDLSTSIDLRPKVHGSEDWVVHVVVTA